MIQSVLESRYWIQPGALTPLSGGLIHQVWRTETDQVVKLYQGADWRPKSVAETLEIQSYAAWAGHPVPHVRQTPDGAWTAPAGEGFITITAFIEGRKVDGTAYTTELAAEAGRTLARLHLTLATLPTGEKPPFIPEEALIRQRCESLLEQGAGDSLAEEAARYRLAALETYPINPADYEAMTWQVVHGDYYPGNLLVGAEGRIAAILDWDFAGPHWRELEVARASVECALTAAGGIDLGRLAAFVDAYSEVSPVTGRQRRRMFRLWFNYMLWSLYPLTLRYKPGADLPREYERLARRRHAMLTLVGSHLEVLEA